MQRTIWTSGLLLLVCLLAGPIVGGEKGKETKDDAKEKRQITDNARKVMNVAAAYQMAEIGRQQKAPELLIAAARVIGSTNSVAEKLSAKSQVTKQLEADEVKEAVDLIIEAEKMIDPAAKNAGALEALAKSTKQLVTGERGPVTGPRIFTGYFPGNESDWHDFINVRCRGGEQTYVSLAGYGRPGLDLDLFVVDEETGQQVASETSVGPNSSLSFYVPSNRDYRIEVRNHTRNTPCNRYVLRVN